MAKLLIATNNRGKVNELKVLLDGLYDEVVSLADENIRLHVEEDGDAFEENAVKKARAAYEKTGLDVLADDSGLCVDYLHGAPGAYSARYAGENATDEENNEKLLDALKDAKGKERNAKFVCVAAMVKNGEVFTVSGEVKGRIAERPKGKSGFGYDPLFYSDQYKKTFAELDGKIKNTVSHRAKALQALKERLEEINAREKTGGKRILVVSDTHNIMGPVKKAIHRSGPFDYIFHLGDYVGDTKRIKDWTNAKVIGVKGNCDLTAMEKKDKLFIINGKKIFMTHGHRYGVKYAYARMYLKAAEVGAEVCLFGHTHVAFAEYMKGVLMINPGSISEPRASAPTYAVLTIDKEIISHKIVVLAG